MVLPQLRVARPDEALAVAALVNAAFQVEAFFKRGDRTNAAEVLDLMQRGEFLVLDEPDEADDSRARLTACVYARVNGDRGYFGMLSIDPRCQGRGLGRSMVAAVESRFRAQGCRAVDIHVVNLREELPPFYERFGYVISGTLPFPDDGSATQPCHFIVMTKCM
ncbi:MAG TPA: GNAT family N-acetyltransferase [Vicinamibacterales bacterium]|nr:GNAT family N-acetyltransferase [Vicinamibacterales bacterium]